MSRLSLRCSADLYYTLVIAAASGYVQHESQHSFMMRCPPPRLNGNAGAAGMSVSNHLLAAYTDSMRAILVSQYSSKRFKGGMAGVLRLAESSVPVRVGMSHLPLPNQPVYSRMAL